MQIPIPVLHLFPILDQKLIELLRSLTPEQWQTPTRAKYWTVKDIATHLLDGNIRTLSMLRDQYFGETPGKINTYQDLVTYLNQLNADWVKATKRLSPQVLIDLLESTGKEYVAHLNTLDPFSNALFAVGWAGEETSANWFHLAREYSEKWHHQQQIREAVKQEGIQSRALYFPVLDTFMRALPHHYRNTQANEGLVLKISISGQAGGEWYLVRTTQQWQLLTTETRSPNTEVILDDAVAWKLFTKGLSAGDAEKLVTIYGNQNIGRQILSMLSVMA